MELSITLIELDNQECPNIGTITCKEGNHHILKEKAIQALESHFDTEVRDIIIQDSLTFEDVRNSPPLDAEVITNEWIGGDDAVTFRVELQQTFIY